MTDVLFVVRGRPGMGHITPSMAIAKRLPEKIDFKFISYDIGTKLLNKQGFSNYKIEGPVLGERKCPWLELLEIEKQIKPIIIDEKPKLIVADGEYYLPIFCKFLGIKNAILTTTNYVEASVGPYKDYSDSIKILFSYADKVLVHGIKFPNTKIKATFVGPIVDETDNQSINKLRYELKQNADILISVTKGGGELEHILDAERYKKDSDIIMNICRKVQKKLNNSRFVYFSGSDSKIKNSKPFVPNMLNYFAISDIVIARAGLVTIEELAYLSIPSILIVPRNDAEKLQNAKTAKNIGFADFIKAVELNEKTLMKKIDVMLQKRKKISKLPKIKNGTETAVKNIIELIGK